VLDSDSEEEFTLAAESQQRLQVRIDFQVYIGS
jgi:hypothetical protein